MIKKKNNEMQNYDEKLTKKIYINSEIKTII